MQQTKTKASAESETGLFADLSNGTNRALSSLVSMRLGRISIESIKGRSSMAIQLMEAKSLVKKMHSLKVECYVPFGRLAEDLSLEESLSYL